MVKSISDSGPRNIDVVPQTPPQKYTVCPIKTALGVANIFCNNACQVALLLHGTKPLVESIHVTRGRGLSDAVVEALTTEEWPIELVQKTDDVFFKNLKQRLGNQEGSMNMQILFVHSPLDLV